jgi:CubicO group peptidase (beta-lactamase class C family)
MIRLCATALAASLAISTMAGDGKEMRIQRVTRQMPPPVSVRGEPPVLTSLGARMAELRVPAVSIAVFHKGRIEWARVFGVTGWGGPPVTNRTLFQAASISKPVFALALLRLADTDKVDLRADVNEYLTTWNVPESSLPRHAPVTLRALLSHSAGITGQGFPATRRMQRCQPFDRSSTAHHRLTTVPFASTPGSEIDIAIPAAVTSSRRQCCKM